MKIRDEFFVGYLPSAPPGIAAWVRRTVLVLLAGSLFAGALVNVGEGPFTASNFEFGVERKFSGRIRSQPHPAIEITRPGEAVRAGTSSTYLLVAPGKRGAGELIAGLDGRWVELEGSLIYRDGETMVEVVPGTIETIESPSATMPESAVTQDLGSFTLTGEIVDSKCYFGVMNPGRLKTHRACAVRCISGGIPPVFLVTDSGGVATYFLLVGENGRSINQEVLEMVAEPLEITGRVRRDGDQLVLMAEPSGFERVERGLR